MCRTFLSVFILICCTGAMAQGFTSSGNLQVHGGGNLSSSLNFTNSSSAVLVNNGSMYLKGDVTNNEASMSAGSGTLYLNGTSAQAIAGSAVLKTNNLVTDNSASITLNNDLSVGGAHTYTAGLIHSSATPNYLIYESGSSCSGSADGRHATGWVKKIGNTDFTFPVGDNTYLRTVALSNISLSSEFNCHYYTPTQNISNLLPLLVKVKGNEYWQIDKVSGGTAQVTLNWDHSKVAMDNITLSDIVAGHYTAGNWTDAGGTASGDVTTTGSVTSGNIVLFSPFTLAYKSFPIPLKLLSFSGWRRAGTTYLHWITENEQDVDRFAVQRSFDGISFSVIGNITARNSGIRELYNFEDPTVFTGTAYYRLSSIDLDGTFSYSRVIAVSENSSGVSAFVMLNPVRTAITIFNRTGTGGMYDYRLYNSAGQIILKGNISLNSNAAAMIRLPLQIPYGIYSLELVNPKTRFTQQVLVER
ncbi:MAG: hypothetical protein ACT4OJ_05400 [Bacteroidota bacterium]